MVDQQKSPSNWWIFIGIGVGILVLLIILLIIWYSRIRTVSGKGKNVANKNASSFTRAQSYLAQNYTPSVAAPTQSTTSTSGLKNNFVRPVSDARWNEFKSKLPPDWLRKIEACPNLPVTSRRGIIYRLTLYLMSKLVETNSLPSDGGGEPITVETVLEELKKNNQLELIDIVAETKMIALQHQSDEWGVPITSELEYDPKTKTAVAKGQLKRSLDEVTQLVFNSSNMDVPTLVIAMASALKLNFKRHPPPQAIVDFERCSICDDNCD